MKTLHALIAAAFIAGSSAASAVEPIALNDTELDGVTAGAQIIFVGNAAALANAASIGALAVSATTTGTTVGATAIDVSPIAHIAFGGAAAIATSNSAN